MDVVALGTGDRFIFAQHRRRAGIQTAPGRGVRRALAARPGGAGGLGADRPRRRGGRDRRRVPGGRDAGGRRGGVDGRVVVYAGAGAETGWTTAFALLALLAWRDGRAGAAIGFGVGCALLRVEAWPFLFVAGVVAWRRHPELRGLLVLCAVAVPALWFVPEWLGSGDLTRSGARARVSNSGPPATEAVPALAALREAAALPLWPLWIGACFTPARLRPVLFAGLAWIALVALMAQAGFSGEPRYSLPGGACVAVAAAAGLLELVRRRAAYAALVAVALLVAAAPSSPACPRCGVNRPTSGRSTPTCVA